VAKSRKAWADEVCEKKELIRFEDEREGKTFEFLFYPILDNHGDVTEIAVYVHETTARKRAEEGLEQKIRELETFINNIPHMAWLKDSDSNFILANQAFADVVGMSTEYLKSNSCAVCFGEKAAEKFKEDDRKVMEGKEQIILEETITDKDGRKRHLETTKSPIFSNTGDIVGTVGVAIDITERKWAEEELRKYRNQLKELVEERTSELKQEIAERKKAEESLQKSEQLLRDTFKAIPDLLTVHDKDLRVIMSNWHTHNYVPEETRESNPYCYKAYMHRDTPCESCHCREIFKTGKPIRLEKTNPVDGKTREISAFPIFDDNNNVVMVAEHAHDITERIEARVALHEANNIINRSPAVAFLWQNAEGWPVEFVSNNVTKLFGFSVEEFTSGKVSYAETIHTSDLERVKGEVQRYSKEKRLSEFRHEPYRIITKSGDIKWLDDMTYIRRNTDDTITHYQGIVMDITERKQLREQLHQSEKMDAIGQLAGGIAHDFNNQLSGIMGYADLLRLKAGDNLTLALYANNIITGVERASNLTSQLLAFARKGQVMIVPVDIHRTVFEVVNLLKHSIEKKIEIKQQLNANLCTTMGDPTQLQNAVLNLGLNARDAMPDGGELSFATDIVELDEKYCKSKPYEIIPGKYLQVCVSDTGCGMGKKTLKRIFEPFFTTKEQGKGIGMGLAAVYGTVKSHNGSISVNSKVGRGTTFTLYLPLVSKEDSGQVKSDTTQPAKSGRHILLVDDEKVLRDVGLKMLGELGYKASICSNGKEAVELYKKSWKSIDLVILDMVMPVMDGKDSFLAMRKINPDISALLASGYSIDGEAQGILDVGVKGFIQKPFKSDQLSRKIAEVLNNN
jgi:PAS domain S-box-containing protein